MPSSKPKVGDLVRLDRLAQEELDTYEEHMWDNVGLVVECVGIRCKVRWINEMTTRPMRSVLEIINASR
jgi:hypothetical protein